MKQEKKSRVGNYIIFVVIIFLTGCASKVIVSDNNWQDKPIKVDGKAKEWEVPLRFYDVDSKLNYTITNDDSNLYYCIRITDDKEEMRVLRAGMEVWIDTAGNKARQIGIQYPYPQMKSKSASDSASITAAHSHFSEYAKEMHLTGFIAPIAGLTQVPNIYGINVAIARDSTGVMIYEGCIPFKTFYKPALTAADKTKMFGITIILNPMPESSHSDEHKGHGAGSSMPGAGMGGIGAMGGMGAAMTGTGGGHKGSSGGEAEESTATRPALVRLKVRLASKTM
jgi:hypothetical protein